MKGDSKIIAILNEVLKAELTAINQYFLHAEMCENWGYERLAKLVKKESIEEMVHAEKCMERILYLDGTPNMSDYFKINIGATVEAQIKNDLQLEYDAVKRLNDGIKLCTAASDSGSRDPLSLAAVQSLIPSLSRFTASYSSLRSFLNCVSTVWPILILK